MAQQNYKLSFYASKPGAYYNRYFVFKTKTDIEGAKILAHFLAAGNKINGCYMESLHVKDKVFLSASAIIELVSGYVDGIELSIS